MNRLLRNRLPRSPVAAVVLAIAVGGVVSACGEDKPTVPGPSRAEAIAAIQHALPDIQPASPSNGAAFDKLLKACIAVGRLDDKEHRATSPSLSKKELADLHTASSVCTSDSARAHSLLQTIAP